MNLYVKTEAIATAIRVMMKWDADAPVDMKIQGSMPGVESRVIVYIPEYECVSLHDIQWLAKYLFRKVWMSSIYIQGTADGCIRLSISTFDLKARYYGKES